MAASEGGRRMESKEAAEPTRDTRKREKEVDEETAAKQP
jgi:hypothetical protein